MAADMERACDADELVDRCEGCGGVLEPRDAEPHVVYDCFHALHSACADGRDACPRCDTPRRVHNVDDEQQEQVEEVAAASVPVPDSASEDGCCACACSRRVAELERRLVKCCALAETTTNVLQAELERARNRLRRIEEMYKKLEKMYEKLEERFVRLCGGKRARAREIEDGEIRKKPRENGGSRKERSWFPTGPDRLNQRRLFHGGLFSYEA